MADLLGVWDTPVTSVKCRSEYIFLWGWFQNKPITSGATKIHCIQKQFSAKVPLRRTDRETPIIAFEHKHIAGELLFNSDPTRCLLTFSMSSSFARELKEDLKTAKIFSREYHREELEHWTKAPLCRRYPREQNISLGFRRGNEIRYCYLSLGRRDTSISIKHHTSISIYNGTIILLINSSLILLLYVIAFRLIWKVKLK